MTEYDLIVIGAGASGYAAAINAGRLHPGLRIAILERLPRGGKKILSTGNGRCNLSNAAAGEHAYTNAAFASGALSKYGVSETLRFFESLGLLTYEDSAGRIYPASNTAASVLDALRLTAQSMGIEVKCESEVGRLVPTGDSYCINGQLLCKYLIIAAGGMASPAQGSDGSGFELAKALGHTVTRLYPALVPVCADASFTKQLKGIRIHRAALRLEMPNGNVRESSGEILFTDYGISGIAAMELAADMGQAAGTNVKLDTFTYIDFMPDMTAESLKKYLKNIRNVKGNLGFDNLLTGILPKQAGIAICKAIELYTNAKNIGDLSDTDLQNLVAVMKNFPLKVMGTRGFDNAQVTRGGICVSEIDGETMQSKINKNLYFAGEIIDVDGGCGGFNLQWAWSSGLLAGELGGNNK